MVSDVAQLNATFGRPGAVSFTQHELGGVVAHLASAGSSATVALHGAHVLSFQPKGGREVLWMSPQAVIAPGEGIRGGIPVCWPWFAAHATDPGKPDHGFVRKSAWTIVRTSNEAGAAHIELEFPFEPKHAALWPAQGHVGVTITLTDTLRVDLVTRNTGTSPFELTEALHTYFAVCNVAEIAVLGLQDRSYQDKLQNFAVVEQTGAITFAGEVDRIYENTTDDVVIEDPVLSRKIRIAKAGSTSTVVWNPWIEKSTRLSHMPAEAYLGMVCVETTNAGGDVVTLQPGASHRLSTILSVEPL